MSEKLRLLFSKQGRAVYISHLDLMRTMQRVFLRAGYKLKYSEGFNPHPVISILLPLGVGVSSKCELMDFQLAEPAATNDIPVALTRVMPEGIAALEVFDAERKVKELKWLRIIAQLGYDHRRPDVMCDGLKSFFAKEQLVIMKKTKRGVSETNIAPDIRQISFSIEERSVQLDAVISAQEPTLNPDNLISALHQLAPELMPDYSEFTRIEVYDENMSVFR